MRPFFCLKLIVFAYYIITFLNLTKVLVLSSTRIGYNLAPLT